MANMVSSKSMGSPPFVRRPHHRRRHHVCHCVCTGAYRHLHTQATQVRCPVSKKKVRLRTRPQLCFNSIVMGGHGHVGSNPSAGQSDHAAFVHLVAAGCS
jgi:hypothetical protein